MVFLRQKIHSQCLSSSISWRGAAPCDNELPPVLAGEYPSPVLKPQRRGEGIQEKSPELQPTAFSCVAKTSFSGWGGEDSSGTMLFIVLPSLGASSKHQLQPSPFAIRDLQVPCSHPAHQHGKEGMELFLPPLQEENLCFGIRHLRLIQPAPARAVGPTKRRRD